MRTLIVLVLFGVSLGLAAQWWPRALGRAAPVVAIRQDGSLAPSPEPPASPSPSEWRMVSESVSSAGSTVATDEEPADEEVIAAEGTDEIETSPEVVAGPDTTDHISALTAAGFTPGRARELLLRESELRREAVNAEYAATGTLQPLNASARSAAARQLRKELGDSDYERYLKATGQPTRVRIGAVESDSTAANAGLQSGDEVLEYAGKRVFSPLDLNALMLKTSTGETVPAIVVRDGQKLHLYVTGGPLGISQSALR